MLLVRFRERLPAGWSYPVGAELLTEVLENVPHGANEPISFWHGEPYRLKDRRRRSSEDLPLPVLEAEFTSWGLGMDRPERPLWTIRVNSVPSHLRKWVREALIAHGLPRLRQWLLQPFADTALEAWPRCRILLQEDQKRLLWEHRDSTFVDARIEVLADAGETERSV